MTYDRSKSKPNSGMFKKGHADLVPKEARKRASLKNSGPNNKMFGKHPTLETIEKMRIARVGIKLSEEHKKAISKANTGRKISTETRRKISIAQSGENGNNWKGDKTKYRSLHERVYRVRGKADRCDVCGGGKHFDWANLTGNYLDVNDYKKMCKSCHSLYDRKRKKINGGQNVRTRWGM